NPVFIARYMTIEGETKVNKRRIIRDAIIAAVIGLLFILFKVYWFGNLLVSYSLLILINTFVLAPISVRFQRSFLPWLENHYNGIVNFSLSGRNPVFILVGTIFALIFSFVLMGV